MSKFELLDGIPSSTVAAARALLEAACKADLSLVTAESCTGGLLASLLTDIEGFSNAFERGYVVYSPVAKCELLHIAEEQINSCGAVSEEVARAMAEGALKASHGDIALSITGFAGPGGPNDESGRVHFGCARRDGTVAHEERHFGDIGRGPVRLACLDVALGMMGDAVAALSCEAVSA
jgi:nicotinamide-nucleotide amidase